MEIPYSQQPAIYLEIPAVATPPTETTDGFYELREWQTRCFNKLRGRRNWMIIAPPAAGKSVEICAIAADRLKRDDDLKVIIAVPQTMIAAGFRANRIVLPDGTRVEWTIQSGHDLCRERPQQSAAHLVGFLSAPNSQEPMSRVLLCTHSTLVRAFAKDKSAFRNILLVIDEGHHSRHSEYDDPDIEVDNQLGALVRYSLLHPDKIQLGLTTATFFRGDHATIIPDVSQFTRFEFPYDEYLATCKHLRSFSYEFLTHSASFIEPLAHLFAQRIGKTIVYIPPVGTSCSLGTKAQDVDAVLKTIAGTDAYVVHDQDQPIMRLKRGNEWVKVVNLVDEHLREEKKEVIIAAHEKPDSSDIDVIIALGLFKEGANWRWADREVIIGQRGSLTELSQMIGRVLRDAPGKDNVEVVQLLPFVFDQTDKTQMRRSLNDYFTAILQSMLIESVISPVLLPVGKRMSTPGEGEHRINYLREACSDDSQAAIVLEEIRHEVFDAFADGGPSCEAYATRETFRSIVADVLTSHGIYEYNDEVADQIYQMFKRRTALLKGLNIGNVDVDLISENPFAFYLQYASEACGIKTFRELRSASRTCAWVPFEQARSVARSLKLRSRSEWNDYCESGKKSRDVPANPQTVYRSEGWAGFGDWLGTERKAPRRQLRSFVDARQFVRSLGLTSQRAWREYCVSGYKPHDIPSSPHSVYNNEGWLGISDWLGAGKGSASYRPFADARQYVQRLGLNSRDQWKEYCKSEQKPRDIPTYPNIAYRECGWIGYSDWLDTGRRYNRGRPFRSLTEGRVFVRALGLKSRQQWRQYCTSGEKPADIPGCPHVFYADCGWIGYGDWLGTGNLSNRAMKFRPFLEARSFVNDLGLLSHAQWVEYCNSGEKPIDIPRTPGLVYKGDGWIGFTDWLKGKPARKRALRFASNSSSSQLAKAS